MVMESARNFARNFYEDDELIREFSNYNRFNVKNSEQQQKTSEALKLLRFDCF